MNGISKRNISPQEKIFSTAAHAFAFGILKAFDAPYLMGLIQRNYQFPTQVIYFYAKQSPVMLQNAFRHIWRNNRQKIMHYLTIDEIKWQMQEHRPDLLQVFQVMDGHADRWFQNLFNQLVWFWDNYM